MPSLSADADRTHKTAIVFAAHEFSRTTCAAYRKLAREAIGHGELFVLTDGVRSPPEELGARVASFDLRKLKAELQAAMRSETLTGNTHVTLWDFQRRHRDYDFYWFIEYDVRFSGSWARFLERFRANEADLLACHVRRFAEEPAWCWWQSLSMAGEPFREQDLLRAFLPIHRLSRRAFQAIENALRRGFTGHFEGLVPTVLALEGLSIEDFGGDGSFVRSENQDAFYSSRSSQDGGLWGGGTMRFRPPHAVWGMRRDRLYHPVKPIGGPLRAISGLAQDLRALAVDLRRSLRAESWHSGMPGNGVELDRDPR